MPCCIHSDFTVKTLGRSTALNSRLILPEAPFRSLEDWGMTDTPLISANFTGDSKLRWVPFRRTLIVPRRLRTTFARCSSSTGQSISHEPYRLAEALFSASHSVARSWHRMAVPWKRVQNGSNQTVGQAVRAFQNQMVSRLRIRAKKTLKTLDFLMLIPAPL